MTGSASTSNPAVIAVYTLKVERDLLDQFRAVAESNDRTVAGEIRAFMRHAVASQSDEMAA